ncbi:MAG: HigA family addiction module antidote protein [Spirochaetaceae bacterium]|jgi:addiction module HigA family antidote|nr:HigA family addiction module antidote protein [Spirochaetaceae bacterium]
MAKVSGAAGMKTPGGELKKLIEQNNLSVRATAIELGENPIGIKAVIDNKKKVNVELALKLAKVFGTTPAYWIELQTNCDLAEAKGKASLQKLLSGMKKASQIESGRRRVGPADAKKSAPSKAAAQSKKPGPKKAAVAAPKKPGPKKTSGV